MSLNINEIYNLLQNNKWEEILTLEKKYRKEILDDNNLKHLFNTFFLPQVIKYAKGLEKLYSHIVLKKVYFHFLHIRNSPYTINDEIFEELAVNYINALINIEKKDNAFTIAKEWSNISSVKEFIKEYEKENLKDIKHTQDSYINLKMNDPVNKKLSTPLFKSKQEIEFFYAIREYYPNHFIYPNVAISCIIDFKEVKNVLSEEESKFFFTGIVDCVIFKQEDNNFYPEICFELDSIFHDDEKQKQKDKLKNEILTKSGYKIYRIRSKENKSLKRDELKKLINDEVTLR